MAISETGNGLRGSCPADATHVAAIRRAIRDVARRCGASELTLTRLDLAVTEATTNVVLHAYRAPARAGFIHVAAGLSGNRFDVRIRDDGVGMSPNPDSPGLGLGLSLMAHESDVCEIRTLAGGGTEICLGFLVERTSRHGVERSIYRGNPTGAGATA